jgi:3-deoxy-7-phosphoheptulonate synthase
MIVLMQPGTNGVHVSAVTEQVQRDGYVAHVWHGVQTIVAIVGNSAMPLKPDVYASIGGVEKVTPVKVPYTLASRQFHAEDTHVNLNGAAMGGAKTLVIAGPCSVESRQQIIETAHAVKEAGATALRGGAFKPRTSPYSFQGHGELGLQWLAEAREQTGLPIVTEVMDPHLVPMVSEYADVLQVGARNMQNFTLLSAVGQSRQAVLLKRGMSSTVEDLLMAAEYILAGGNANVMVCERGIRTFETSTRNTFDLNAIPVLKNLTHLPVIADPSHAVGKSELVEPVARAAIAAGADGLILEVHLDPANAMSDGRQSLTPAAFTQLMESVRRVAEAVGRSA